MSELYNALKPLFSTSLWTDPLIWLLFVSIIVTRKSLWRAIGRHIKRKKYLKSSLCKVDQMSGIEFEEFLEAHFKKQGFHVELTPTTNDYGADLILRKNGVTTVVQAKRYNGKVGNKAVQEIVAAMPYYGADNGMVITNSFFSKNAEALAQSNHVVLIDRNSLEKFISKQLSAGFTIG